MTGFGQANGCWGQQGNGWNAAMGTSIRFNQISEGDDVSSGPVDLSNGLRITKDVALEVLKRCVRQVTIETPWGRYKACRAMAQISRKWRAELQEGREPPVVSFECEDVHQSIFEKFISLINGNKVTFQENEVNGLLFIYQVLDYGAALPPSVRARKVSNLLTLECDGESFIGSIDVRSIIKVVIGKRTYDVPIDTACLSDVVRKVVEAGGDTYTYESDDESDAFSEVYEYLCTRCARVSRQNMRELQRIAADLHFAHLQSYIDEYISQWERGHAIVDSWLEGHKRTASRPLEVLFEMTEENFTSLSGSLDSDGWFSDRERVKELISYILMVVVRRGEAAARVMVGLIKMIDERADDDFLVEYLTRRVVRDLYDRYGVFICMLRDEGLISIDVLVNELSSPRHAGNIHAHHIKGLFLGESEKNATMATPAEQQLAWNHRGYSGWGRSSTLVLPAEVSEALVTAIRSDDLEQLQDVCVEKQIDWNAQLDGVRNDDFDDYHRVSILSFAATCEALKCILFLLTNDVHVEFRELHEAVYAGNAEIVRLFDERYQKGRKSIEEYETAYGKLICDAISSHRNGIFHWIFETKLGSKLNRDDGEKAVAAAVTSGNFDALLTLVDMGIKVMGFAKMVTETYSVVDQGCFDMLQLIDRFACGETDPQIYATGGLLKRAAGNGMLPMMEFIARRSRSLTGEWLAAFVVASSEGHDDVTEWIQDHIEPSVVSHNISRLLEGVAGTASKKTRDSLFKFVRASDDLVPAMRTAVLSGNVEFAKELIRKEIDRDSEASFGTIFCAAIRQGLVEVTDYLKGQDIRMNFEEILSTMDVLIAGDHLERIQLLFDSIPEEGETIRQIAEICLKKALVEHRERIVAFLLDYSDVRKESLIDAARSGSTAMVQAIMRVNSPEGIINHKNERGTALCAAARTASHEVVDILLKVHGVNPNLCDKHGQTPFMIAASVHDIYTMRALISSCGDKLREASWQLSAAFVLAFSGGLLRIPWSSNCVRVEHPGTFIGRGPNTCGIGSMDSFARYDDEFELVRFFLELPSIDIHYRHEGMTILLIASMRRCNEVIKEVLKIEGVKPNVLDAEDNTPLIICAATGNVTGVELLMSHEETDAYHMNCYGATAFSAACADGQIDVVQYLMGLPTIDIDRIAMGLGLIWAIKYQRLDVIAEILHVSFDINEFFDIYISKPSGLKTKRVSPLRMAIRQCDLVSVNLILNHPRFDRDSQDLSRFLFVCVKHGNLDVFGALLELLHDVNIFNRKHESLLTYACYYGRETFVHDMVKHDSFDAVKSRAVYALGAVLRSSAIPLIPIISAMPGVDINANLPNDINGLRVATFAQYSDEEYCVLRFDQADGESDGESMDETWSKRTQERKTIKGGVPPLIAYACKQDLTLAYGQDDLGLIESFYQVMSEVPGINMNVMDRKGRTFMFVLMDSMISRGKQEEDLRRLLRFCDINSQDCDGNTLLHIAVRNGREKAIVGLLTSGADKTIRNNLGLTPWEAVHTKAYGRDAVPEQPDDITRYSKSVMEAWSYTQRVNTVRDKDTNGWEDI